MRGFSGQEWLVGASIRQFVRNTAEMLKLNPPTISHKKRASDGHPIERIEIPGYPSVPLEIMDTRKPKPFRSFQCIEVLHALHWSGKDLLWAGITLGNLTPNEGEKWICEVVFSEVETIPTDYYFLLCNAPAFGAEAETDTMSSKTEVSGSGYARQAVPSSGAGWTVSESGGDYQAASSQETFTATGAWTDAGTLGMSDEIADAGSLISIVSLSQTRSLGNGDSLDVDLTVAVKEPA